MRHIISALVQNVPGVLSHIAGMLASRGYNIESLYVNQTENPELSRMLIVSRGDAYVQTQMVRQLSKLYDVKEVSLMSKVNR